MRVIHHDGRTGTFEFQHPHSVCGYVSWDDGSERSFHAVVGFQVRPLGPIEEELLRFEWRNRHPFSLSNPAFDFLHLGVDWGLDWTFAAEALSDALEACARIYEQHGESI